MHFKICVDTAGIEHIGHFYSNDITNWSLAFSESTRDTRKTKAETFAPSV